MAAVLPLLALPCRHLLLILDCCFAGAFKWASQTRDIGALIPKVIYRERFDRFILDPSLAGHHLGRLRPEGDGRPGGTGDRRARTGRNDAGVAHSPFALAPFGALGGGADFRTGRGGDGVITATELYPYVRDRVEPEPTTARASARPRASGH